MKHHLMEIGNYYSPTNLFMQINLINLFIVPLSLPTRYMNSYTIGTYMKYASRIAV